ncbi:2Fe-2S iron-sulfur cluster-binding protein [Stappia sp.]|uniref:2Fe-2S iron-sulfur cluster-binding protein n=1 Tax=Stappia sp. TaxID=1870903 RepID=UPI0032D8C865
MARITFVEPDGTRKEIDAVDGRSVMETAIANDVNGIVAECAGSMACATCHVFVDEAHFAGLPEAEQAERDMLDFAAVTARPTSRLSCQIAVGPQLDGAVITIPETQV